MAQQQSPDEHSGLASKIILGAAAVSLAGLVAVIAFDITPAEGFGLFERRTFFAKKCLHVLKETLRSPSTLDVLEVSEYGATDTNPDPQRVYITYDAANAYGAPVRSLAYCTGDGQNRIKTYEIDGQELDATRLNLLDLSANLELK